MGTPFQGYGPDGGPELVPPMMPEWPGTVIPVLQGIDARRQKWVQKLKGSPSYDPGGGWRGAAHGADGDAL